MSLTTVTKINKRFQNISKMECLVVWLQNSTKQPNGLRSARWLNYTIMETKSPSCEQWRSFATVQCIIYKIRDARTLLTTSFYETHYLSRRNMCNSILTSHITLATLKITRDSSCYKLWYDFWHKVWYNKRSQRIMCTHWSAFNFTLSKIWLLYFSQFLVFLTK